MNLSFPHQREAFKYHMMASAFLLFTPPILIIQCGSASTEKTGKVSLQLVNKWITCIQMAFPISASCSGLGTLAVLIASSLSFSLLFQPEFPMLLKIFLKENFCQSRCFFHKFSDAIKSISSGIILFIYGKHLLMLSSHHECQAQVAMSPGSTTDETSVKLFLYTWSLFPSTGTRKNMDLRCRTSWLCNLSDGVPALNQKCAATCPKFF